MKNLFFLLLFLPVLCHGQKDLCKKIKRTTEPGSGAIRYHSPELKNISIIKEFGVRDFFALHIHFFDKIAHPDARGIVIELEDGSLIKDENSGIDCKQEMSVIVGGDANSSFAHSGKYLLQGFLYITEDILNKVTSQKIIKVQLDKVSRRISKKEATVIMCYIECLKDTRP